ncbi:MAG: DUF4388 domain-containing protein [Candidatus Zixiibacteriota bacterium]
MDLDLQGSIDKFTLPEIFQLIAAGRKSGTLGIQRDESIIMVYFKNGDIIYGYGPRQTYHLGQLLKERGKLTAEQLEDAVHSQAMTENTKRLGEILVNKGYIDRADLQRVVEEQVENLLYSLLSWQSGSFKFYENQFPTEEEITVEMSVENVILEGLRRFDEMNMIKEALPDWEAVYAISSSQGGRTRSVSLEAPQWNVMALVDGRRSVNEICACSPLGRDETLKRLAQLKLAGIITPAGTKESTQSPTQATPHADIEAMISNLARLFENYLNQRSTSSATVNRMTTRTLSGEKLESR